MIKTIIVDDEPEIIHEMKFLLEELKGFDIVGVYTNPLQAIEEAGKKLPECAFLDIEMFGMSGLEVAERLSFINPNIEVVFVTAYNNYASQAFEVNAIDYILKPIKRERLERLLVKLLNKKENNSRENNNKVGNSKCSIKSFGDFVVSIGDQTIKWKRHKTKELFAYLLQLQGKSILKYKLCELLWPELSQEQALANLQTSIWAMRKSFKEICFEGIKIEYHDDRYIVKLEDVEWDVLEFEKYYQIYKKTGSEKDLEKALVHYSGEYLEGEEWLWAYAPRENYRIIRKSMVVKMRKS